MCMSSLAEELLAKIPEQRERWLAEIKTSQAAVALHFDAERNVLMERAHRVRGVSHEEAAGRLFNPGHSIEVAWFLLHLCRLVPNDDLQAIALRALEGSLERGWDREHGGLYYMIDILGKPLLDATVTAEHKLWWPITEALYACTLALEVSGGDAKWLRWLRTVHAYAYEKLCDADGGGEWYGYLRPDGTPFSACKGGNYKGFFHVPRALLYALRSAERQGVGVEL